MKYRLILADIHTKCSKQSRVGALGQTLFANLSPLCINYDQYSYILIRAFFREITQFETCYPVFFVAFCGQSSHIKSTLYTVYPVSRNLSLVPPLYMTFARSSCPCSGAHLLSTIDRNSATRTRTRKRLITSVILLSEIQKIAVKVSF